MAKPLPGGAFYAARQRTEARVRRGFSRAASRLEPEPAAVIHYYYLPDYLLGLSQESGREIGQFQLKRPLL
jgi:hypothetical protein